MKYKLLHKLKKDSVNRSHVLRYCIAGLTVLIFIIVSLLNKTATRKPISFESNFKRVDEIGFNQVFVYFTDREKPVTFWCSLKRFNDVKENDPVQVESQKYKPFLKEEYSYEGVSFYNKRNEKYYFTEKDLKESNQNERLATIVIILFFVLFSVVQGLRWFGYKIKLPIHEIKNAYWHKRNRRSKKH